MKRAFNPYTYRINLKDTITPEELIILDGIGDDLLLKSFIYPQTGVYNDVIRELKQYLTREANTARCTDVLDAIYGGVK